MYDLTHRIESGMQTYPGDPPVGVETVATHEADGYRVSRLRCGSHTGTHVDAPAHTEPDGRTLGSYPVSAFERDAVRVDCRDIDAGDRVPAERVPAPETFEDPPDCVVFWTGWDRHFGTERYAAHPALSPAAASACAAAGYAVGLDTQSPDPTGAADLPAHHALLGADCLVFENLAGLGRVSRRFELRAQPLALDADGAPVRAVGVDADTD